MMGAASLPTPQASTPAGFAAFLSTIGQTPTGDGESGGFDQLLAAAPMPVAAPVKAAPVAVAADSKPAAATPLAVNVPTPVAARVAGATGANAAPVGIPTIVAAPATAATAATVDAPITVAKAVDTDTAPTPPADPDAAAASAAQLLIAANGKAAGPQPKLVKPDAAQPDTETAPRSDTGAMAEAATRAPGLHATETAAPVAAPGAEAAVAPAAAVAAAPVVAAMVAPVASKSTKPADTAATPTREAAAATAQPIAAPVPGKPRAADAKPDAAPGEAAPVAGPAASKTPAAAPTRPIAVAAADAAPVKTGDAAPSMTIQFAQPAAPGIALNAHIAQPVTVAERVLDLASDGAWIDQLAHDIAATKSDSGDISFRLMPRHLGRLDVAMLMGDEGVSLKLDTQHEATATIVTAAQGRLVEDLRQQGVRVAGSEVSCTPGDGNRQMQGQGRGAAPDVSHLIETVTERVKARDSEEAADRRGRFA